MTEKKIIENPGSVAERQVVYTAEDMERDRAFYMAKSMTDKLLDEGMITADEYEAIMDEHILNFSPILAPIMQ